MSNANTGGPAFPSGLIDPSTPEDAVHSLHNGMTLRDYFAAKALQEIIVADYNLTPKYVPSIAASAYVFADAMLKAREQ